MKTKFDYSHTAQFVSDEVYEVLDNDHPSLRNGDKVRLISGVDKSRVPGFHFEEEYLTVCRESSEQAEFLGVKKTTIKLVEPTTDKTHQEKLIGVLNELGIEYEYDGEVSAGGHSDITINACASDKYLTVVFKDGKQIYTQ